MDIHHRTRPRGQADSQALIRRNDEDVLRHQAAVIAAIELKHLNGVAVRMVLGPFAMLVDCVSFHIKLFFFPLGPKLTPVQTMQN